MSERKWLPRTYHAFFGSRVLLSAQREAIPLVLQGKNILLMAPTGAGKTEAVVAPLAERALDFPGETYVLYVVPTRALVNDLEHRLSERLRECGLRLAVRHGERNTIPGRQRPAFILTTPESLEVMLSTQPEYIRECLRGVRAVVVDEAHQLYDSPRGLQLVCLLERLKALVQRPLQRLCLSATVDDAQAFAELFGGSDGPLVTVRVPPWRDISLNVAFIGCDRFADFGRSAAEWVGEILSRHRKILLFANTRVECEWLCWQLSSHLHGLREIPVLLHYSSLSKAYREWVESRFRRSTRAVCVSTSTLELGIDIGDVDAVAMWGPPNTVTSFLQRLGRGNRRTNTNVVYGACRRFYPSGSEADPVGDLVTFVSLVHLASDFRLEKRSLPRYHSVLAQQLLAVCRQWSQVAPDAIPSYIKTKFGWANDEILEQILNHLVQCGLLNRDSRLAIWKPTDAFFYWQARGLFWTNLGGPDAATVLEQANEQPRPLADIPKRYSASLRPGRIIVIAGRPKLVTKVQDQTVHVVDLDCNDPELARYIGPPEPVPREVALGIREVLRMPDHELARLPVRYDDWSRSNLKALRCSLGSKIRENSLTFQEEGEVTTIYTFAGSVANWLLCDWIREQLGITASSDAWRITCIRRFSADAMRQLREDTFRNAINKRWPHYVQRLALPPLFRFLPPHLQHEEVKSLLQVGEVFGHLLSLCERCPER